MLGFVVIWFVCIGIAKSQLTLSTINAASTNCATELGFSPDYNNDDMEDKLSEETLRLAHLCLAKAVGILDDDLNLNWSAVYDYYKIIRPEYADEIMEKCSSIVGNTRTGSQCMYDILSS